MSLSVLSLMPLAHCFSNVLSPLVEPPLVEPPKAKPLLDAVYDHSEKPEFVYEHVWQVGDLILWDNRCSMHGRTDFAETERRLMLRTTVKGDGVPA